MAVALRSLTTGSNPSTVTFIDITVPSGVVDGDLLITVFSNSAIKTLTPPAGWTDLRTTDDTTDQRLQTWWRIAASEPATYQWTFATGGAGLNAMLCFSGAHPTAPIHGSNGQGTASGTTHATPDVTTTVADCLLLALYNSDVAAGGALWTPPSGMTEQYDFETLAQFTTMSGHTEVPLATGTYNRTATLNVTDTAGAMLIAIAPPDVPAGVRRDFAHSNYGQAVVQ